MGRGAAAVVRPADNGETVIAVRRRCERDTPYDTVPVTEGDFLPGGYPDFYHIRRGQAGVVNRNQIVSKEMNGKITVFGPLLIVLVIVVQGDIRIGDHRQTPRYSSPVPAK